ncbi:MAG: DUF2281 domain-containing protein [Bacteroidetes bacterium]|nr:MAG: DUF2281 domain-containing protein [Bacteroidota bacterium]
MTDLELYIKLSSLPRDLKSDVSDFIDFIKYKSLKKSLKKEKRIAGQAKGLISMKNNFEDPIEGFNEYM